MNIKISWYQEIIELDPSSKAFFPLAKLLLAEDQLLEALAVLRYGLDQHPDFIEARLQYIEVLETLDHEEELEAQVQFLADKLSVCPVFWQAWARLVGQRKEGRDFALALNFVAATLRGQEVSWQEVLAFGLRSFMGGEGELMAKQCNPAEDEDVVHVREHLAIVPDRLTSEVAATALSTIFGTAKSAFPVILAADMPLLLSRDQKTAKSEESIVCDLYPVDVAPIEAVTIAPRTSQTRGVVDLEEQQEDGEEIISLRTRTMADLLSEQGDYEGALDIYRELLASASAEAEREELDGLIERLQLKVCEANIAIWRRKKLPQPLNDKDRLIHTLESLAERLEARAAG